MLTGFSFAHEPRGLGVPRRGFYVPRPRQLTLNPGMSPADKEHPMTVIRTERGFLAECISGRNCRYHRNTLLQNGARRVVVSTIGDRPGLGRRGAYEAMALSGRRYYETEVFDACKIGANWNADTSRVVRFNSTSAITASDPNGLPEDVYSQADAMHEAAVEEIAAKLLAGLLS